VSADEARIRERIAAWADALERKDVDGLVAHCAPDLLLFDAIPPYQSRGVEPLRAAWEGCMPYFPDAFSVEQRDLTVAVAGDVAFAHYLHHVLPAEKPLEGAGCTWLRVTECYRKVDGDWWVVHAHISVPFDPISGKAWYITDPDDAGARPQCP
jgi:ketosteroid isomerase-like protein